MRLPPTRARFSRAAGWTAIALGVVHTVVAPYENREQWKRAIDDGWWRTFTLTQATTVPDLRRSETFWVSAGSFGVPMLALGSYIVWSSRNGQRVPRWLGWLLLAWGVPTATALPGSPAWAIPAIGGLVVLGDPPVRRPRHAPMTPR